MNNSINFDSTAVFPVFKENPTMKVIKTDMPGGKNAVYENGYLYVIYNYTDPSNTNYMYSVFDTLNNFKEVTGNNKLNLRLTAKNFQILLAFLPAVGLLKKIHIVDNGSQRCLDIMRHICNKLRFGVLQLYKHHILATPLSLFYR